MLLVNSEEIGLSKIFPSKIETYYNQETMKDTKQWVARIDGICTKFGFKREFVKNSRTKINPNVFWVIYTLDKGHIYQFNNIYASEKEFISGFIYVSPCGSLVSTIEKEQVRVLLNMPSKKREELKDAMLEARSHDNDKYANDDIPF